MEGEARPGAVRDQHGEEEEPQPIQAQRPQQALKWNQSRPKIDPTRP